MNLSKKLNPYSNNYAKMKDKYMKLDIGAPSPSKIMAASVAERKTFDFALTPTGVGSTPRNSGSDDNNNQPAVKQGEQKGKPSFKRFNTVNLNMNYMATLNKGTLNCYNSPLNLIDQGQDQDIEAIVPTRDTPKGGLSPLKVSNMLKDFQHHVDASQFDFAPAPKTRQESAETNDTQNLVDFVISPILDNNKLNFGDFQDSDRDSDYSLVSGESRGSKGPATPTLTL